MHASRWGERALRRAVRSLLSVALSRLLSVRTTVATKSLIGGMASATAPALAAGSAPTTPGKSGIEASLRSIGDELQCALNPHIGEPPTSRIARH